MPILFPIKPFWYVPMHIGQEVTHWTEWSRWYRSDGSRGLEPPQDVKDLIGWWEILRRTEDSNERIKYGKRILQSQAVNIWAIGIIGLGSPSRYSSRQIEECAPKWLLGLGFKMVLALLSRNVVFRAKCKLMVNYIIRRILIMIPTLAVISVLVSP